ncbi:hypothetical protein RFI_32368, partial [Reticulomyxa filosa]
MDKTYFSDCCKIYSSKHAASIKLKFEALCCKALEKLKKAKQLLENWDGSSNPEVFLSKFRDTLGESHGEAMDIFLANQNGVTTTPSQTDANNIKNNISAVTEKVCSQCDIKTELLKFLKTEANRQSKIILGTQAVLLTALGIG